MFQKIWKAKNFAFLLLAGIALLESCNKDSEPIDQSPTNQGPTDPAGPIVTINSFTPDSAARDSIVIITGTNFGSTGAENIVTFNGVAATVLSATTTRLEVEVPLKAGNGKISVKVGSQAISSANNFTYLFTASTLAGNGNPGFIDGPGNIAEFKDAFGLATDEFGNVYVADGSNNCIRKITVDGIVSTIAGDGTPGTRNGPGATAQFNFPHGIALDPARNIYVADAGNNMIRKISPDGIVSTIAGDGTPGLKEGPGASAQFNFPADLVVDAFFGTIYVSDGTNKRIRKITPNGTVSTFATGFGFPEGITLDPDGNLYVADAGSFVVRKVTSTGIVSILAGNGTIGYTDGPGANAQFHNPEGIGIDAAGNLYIGDLNAAIRKITPAGVVSTVAGNGVAGFVNGAAPIARFREPSGIAVDSAGNIFVADVSNSRIRKLQ